MINNISSYVILRTPSRSFVFWIYILHPHSSIRRFASSTGLWDHSFACCRIFVALSWIFVSHFATSFIGSQLSRLIQFILHSPVNSPCHLPLDSGLASSLRLPPIHLVTCFAILVVITHFTLDTIDSFIGYSHCIRPLTIRLLWLPMCLRSTCSSACSSACSVTGSLSAVCMLRLGFYLHRHMTGENFFIHISCNK